MIIQPKSYKNNRFETPPSQNSANLRNSALKYNNQSSDTNFTGRLFRLSENTRKKIYTSKPFKAFAQISSSPVLLESTFVLGLCTVARPLTIISVPGAEKRDKEYAATHSFLSGLWTFATGLVLYQPINNAVNKVFKKIEEDPKYMKGNFIRKKKNKDAFNFVASTGPKTVMHAALGVVMVSLIPATMNLLFPKNKKTSNTPPQKNTQTEKKSEQVNFKGKIPSSEKSMNFIEKIEDKISTAFIPLIEKFAENKHIQKYTESMANSNETKASLLRQVINTGTAFLGTLVYMGTALANPKIEKEHKETLATNYFITWGLSAIGTVALDKGVRKTFKNLANNYEKYNTQEIEETFKKKLLDAKPEKTAEIMADKAKELKKIGGFKGGIAKNAASMICFALMYRYITPVIATPLAEMAKKLKPKKQELKPS